MGVMSLIGESGLCQAILESSTECIEVLDANGLIVHVNRHGLLSMEIDDSDAVVGQPWIEGWPDQIRPLLRDVLAKARGGELGRFDAFCPTHKGTPKWWDVRVSPVRDADGNIRRLIVISSDVTDQRKAEEQQNLLVRELNHRVKNILATVQAIVSLTVRSSISLAEFQDSFTSRIMALAKAHSFLTDERWQTLRLNDVVALELEPYVEKFIRPPKLAGPIVDLPSEPAVLICMVIHELTTNAAKYGALLSAEGRIDFSWRLEAAGTRCLLIMDWIESGSPPAQTPARQGFGMRLLEKVLRGQLKAIVELNFEPAGLSAHFKIPLPERRLFTSSE
jgi:PAS domain S-box-containing protein